MRRIPVRTIPMMMIPVMPGRLARLLAAGTLMLTLSVPAAAGTGDQSSQASTLPDRPMLREAIRRSLPTLMQEEPAPATWIRAQGSYGRITRNRHARLKRDIGMIVGVVGGLYAGAYLGAKIEGDSCRCDDPGFQGGLIGALTGAVLGGIAGAAIGSR